MFNSYVGLPEGNPGTNQTTTASVSWTARSASMSRFQPPEVTGLCGFSMEQDHTIRHHYWGYTLKPRGVQLHQLEACFKSMTLWLQRPACFGWSSIDTSDFGVVDESYFLVDESALADELEVLVDESDCLVDESSFVIVRRLSTIFLCQWWAPTSIVGLRLKCGGDPTSCSDDWIPRLQTCCIPAVRLRRYKWCKMEVAREQKKEKAYAWT